MLARIAPVCPAQGDCGHRGGKHVADEQRPEEQPEEFRPRGTVAILVMFVLAIIILWASVYVILLSRGVTV